LEEAHTENKDLAARLENLEQSRIPIEARLDAHERNSTPTKIASANSRHENSRRVHLLRIDEGEIDVVDGRLERIQKDDGESYSITESGDPPERGGDVSLFVWGPASTPAAREDGRGYAPGNDIGASVTARCKALEGTYRSSGWRQSLAEGKCKRSRVRHRRRYGNTGSDGRRKGISDDYAKKLVRERSMRY